MMIIRRLLLVIDGTKKSDIPTIISIGQWSLPMLFSSISKPAEQQQPNDSISAALLLYLVGSAWLGHKQTPKV